MSKFKYDIVFRHKDIIIGKDCKGYFWSKISDDINKYLFKVHRLNLSDTEVKAIMNFIANIGTKGSIKEII